MKKVLLLAALLGGVSFSGMASNLNSKKYVLVVLRAGNTNSKVQDVEKFKRKTNDCSWVNITSSCGTLAHTYACSMDQVIQRINDMEEDCGN